MMCMVRRTVIETPFPSAEDVAKKLNLSPSRVRHIEEIISSVNSSNGGHKASGKKGMVKGSVKNKVRQGLRTPTSNLRSHR
jgi:hypothetical protein